MTISTATAKTVSDGTGTRHDQPEHGLRVLRDMEARALITIGGNAIKEACSLREIMNAAIFGDSAHISGADLQRILLETLTCMETADHYLRMLCSVLDERPADSQAPWPADPAL